MRRTLFLTIIFIIPLLSGCGKDDIPVLPEGTQTVIGRLVATEISIKIRGSHVLKNEEDVELFFVESKTVNLRPYEGREVMLTGTFEYNIDPSDLPVLVVEEVEAEDDVLRSWNVPFLNLSFEAPVEWEGIPDGDMIQFIPQGTDAPVLTMFADELSEKTFDEFLEDKEKGIPIVVGQERGQRVIDQTSGRQTIYVDRGSSALSILFTPGEDERWLPAFLALLRTLDFSGNATDQPAGGTGSGLPGQPCGGPAGILCPAGQYCEVSDLETNIGKCIHY